MGRDIPYTPGLSRKPDDSLLQAVVPRVLGVHRHPCISAQFLLSVLLLAHFNRTGCPRLAFLAASAVQHCAPSGSLPAREPFSKSTPNSGQDMTTQAVACHHHAASLIRRAEILFPPGFVPLFRHLLDSPSPSVIRRPFEISVSYLTCPAPVLLFLAVASPWSDHPTSSSHLQPTFVLPSSRDPDIVAFDGTSSWRRDRSYENCRTTFGLRV